MHERVGEPRPFFLEGPAGKLFAIFYPPSSKAASRRVIVHVPAFAEEMNKARRMVSLQSVELARHGVGALIFDLFGTGDSEGDFGEARWDLWLEDLAAACRWLRNRGIERISLWGLRMGALLAMDFAARGKHRFENLILWQPALSGHNLIMQFLRLRVASALFASEADSKSETTSELRDRLLNGYSVEVAGYDLGPELVNPLMKLRLAQFEAVPFEKIHLFELVSEPGKPSSAANREWVSAMQEKGLSVETELVCGPSFWSTQEIATVPALLQKTTECIISHELRSRN
ncbi:MAG: hydrolase 2, exosortase A system-associated [Methylococcaceae bacterium]|nr:hydrolase 2, exosortase A system-associated [Methylococcaceae bacterium]MCI0667008.1 hydrolase 2, exosortase A system-associated [Methylococcaceae bacterium]MCI0734080.1 hydrolase 2, exosortase A system-associated [Methylococcaceae bacterium]